MIKTIESEHKMKAGIMSVLLGSHDPDIEVLVNVNGELFQIKPIHREHEGKQFIELNLVNVHH